MRNLPREIILFKFWPVRKMTASFMFMARFIARVASKAKAAAIFPSAINLACHWSVEIKYPQNIVLVRGVVIGKGVTLGALGGITLGDNVRISKGVSIETASLDFSSTSPYKHTASPIVVEKDVWLGAGCIILSGVTLGQGAIIGAGTVVAKDVPPFAVCVGSGSRLISNT